MAARNYKVTATFQRLSGIPQDIVVNDWFFHWSTTGADPASADFDVVANALSQFYNTVPTGGTHAVGEYLSEALSRPHGIDLKYYEIPAARGPLGSPVYTKNKSFSAFSTGKPLPEEMAICLSYRSDYSTAVEFGGGGTRPRARHRGRIFLGPLESDIIVLEDSATHEVTIGTTPQIDITSAAVQSFSAGSAASPLHLTDWTWGQFSPTAWLRQLVTTCWVDNAFDVQRRRGAKPTVRTSGTVL